MAKTYILEPTEISCVFSFDSLLLGSPDTPAIVHFDGDPSANPDFFNDSVLEIEGYPFKVKFAGLVGDQYIFTEDGTMPQAPPSVYAGLGFMPSPANDMYGMDGAVVSPNLPTEDCTLTVSIYTGEDDPEPSGGSISKNFAFEDHSRNDLNGIAEIVAPFESEEA